MVKKLDSVKNLEHVQKMNKVKTFLTSRCISSGDTYTFNYSTKKYTELIKWHYCLSAIGRNWSCKNALLLIMIKKTVEKLYIFRGFLNPICTGMIPQIIGCWRITKIPQFTQYKMKLMMIIHLVWKGGMFSMILIASIKKTKYLKMYMRLKSASIISMKISSTA